MLNVEQFEFVKMGNISSNKTKGTHDDCVWAVALAVYVARAKYQNYSFFSIFFHLSNASTL